jgi:exodeoxyribonuclease VII large subunit
MHADNIYSVSSLTRQIKELLETSFPSLWVEGEISNFKPHYSGHLYFTLKDSEAQISCVMWRSRVENLAVSLQDGLKVRVFAYIRVYERGGRYQLDTLRIEDAGAGELQARFDALKLKLSEEGLFDEKYKQPMPSYPKCIGIVTSPTGAAIRDILSVLKRRSPSVEIIFRGVKVQGEGAAQEIAHAIELFNYFGKVDLLIVGRGGGSLEDLWAFNEEIVARAIFNSNIPVISAVGHEIDFTISDMVADLRAPTPSAGAELVIPADAEIMAFLNDLNLRMKRTIDEKLYRFKKDVQLLRSGYAFGRTEDFVRQSSMRIDELIQRLATISKSKITNFNSQITNLIHRLETLSPEHVLKRGYALIYKEKEVVTSVASIKIEDIIAVRLKDGRLTTTVREISYE